MDDVNRIIAEGNAIKLINLCEARQERKYADAADEVMWHSDRARIVMMSGPSSSGKTSSSLRIAQQCRVLGITPKVIELDNYFVERDRTPLDENGNKDYEALEAMNIELLGQNLNDLLSGKEIIVPKFDFVNGKTIFDESRRMKLEKGDVLEIDTFQRSIRLQPGSHPVRGSEPHLPHLHFRTFGALYRRRA